MKNNVLIIKIFVKKIIFYIFIMCGKDKSAPAAPAPAPRPIPPTRAPAPAAQGNSDPQSDFLFNANSYLAKKVNNEIQIKKTGNSMTMSNISDTDLQKMQFITSTNQSNRHLKMTNCGVSINDSNGTPLTLQIPGLKEMVSQMFINSAADSFLANEKTHKPFKQAVAKAVAPQSNVGDIVDNMTSMMPSMPKTAGKHKKYNLSFSSSNVLCLPGSHSTFLQGCAPN
jgi:hypothetical protein